MADGRVEPEEAKLALVICKNPLCMRFFAVRPGPVLFGPGKFRLTCTECKHENEYQAKDIHVVDGRTQTAINPV
jgi:hypothetical protein